MKEGLNFIRLFVYVPFIVDQSAALLLNKVKFPFKRKYVIQFVTTYYNRRI